MQKAPAACRRLVVLVQNESGCGFVQRSADTLETANSSRVRKVGKCCELLSQSVMISKRTHNVGFGVTVLRTWFNYETCENCRSIREQRRCQPNNKPHTKTKPTRGIYLKVIFFAYIISVMTVVLHGRECEYLLFSGMLLQRSSIQFSFRDCQIVRNTFAILVFHQNSSSVFNFTLTTGHIYLGCKLDTAIFVYLTNVSRIE